MDLARVMDNLCQRLVAADEKYRDALKHLEKLYQENATEREKEIAWVWLRSAQIDREYLQKSFAKDAIPLYAAALASPRKICGSMQYPEVSVGGASDTD